MAEHGALGSAGRARRIEDGRQIIRATRDVGKIAVCVQSRQQRAPAIVIQRFHTPTMACGQRRNAGLCLGRDDNQLRLGVSDEIVQFSQRIACIERQLDGSRPQTGHV